MNRLRGSVIAGLGLSMAAIIAGCTSPDPRTGAAAGQPATPPGRAATPYTEALSCLSEQLKARQIVMQQPTRLGAGNIPDATTRVSPGLRDMVTAAIVRGTRGSTVFIPAESLSLAMIPPASPGGPVTSTGSIISASKMPADPSSLQVYGALTHADRNVQGREDRLGFGDSNNVFGISRNADIANIGIILHLAQVGSGVIRQSVSNQMTVRNVSRGANADFTVKGIGLSFAVSFDEREGLHQAVHTLVDLSVLELLGQEARVPYWHCFQLNRGNPRVQKQIAEWFKELSASDLDSYARERLRVLGYEVPPAPGSMMPVLSTFQRGQGLVPNGLPTFETFAALVDGQLAVGPPGPMPVALPAPAPSGPVRLRLDVTELAIAEPILQLGVLPDRLSNVVCYYRDETGSVWRLLPNRYQPDQAVNADVPLMIPGRITERPVVQPRRMTTEVGFLCAGGSADWAATLPAAMWGNDLTRLPGVSFAALRQAFTAAGSNIGISETTRGAPSGRWSRVQQ